MSDVIAGAILGKQSERAANMANNTAIIKDALSKIMGEDLFTTIMQ